MFRGIRVDEIDDGDRSQVSNSDDEEEEGHIFAQSLASPLRFFH
jgi:hypothetical protein